MLYLIAAQLCRVAVIWTTKMVFKKIFRTGAILFVGGYLIERAKRQNYIDERRGYPVHEESRRINS
jgi:hypothetical protein